LNERSENGKIHYREDLFVGYKHYNTRNIKPLFEFGFGLSYTSFSFANLSVSVPEYDENGLQVTVSVTVKNDGPVAGSEVAQLYMTYPDIGMTTPVYQLKGFAKAKDVAPGASQSLVVILERYAFAFWDSNRDAWVVSPGKYVISIGASSMDMRLRGELELTQGYTWRGL